MAKTKTQPHFSPAFFDFLRELADNNTRDWFTAHKKAYEEHVKGPMLRFIGDVAPRMAKVSRFIEVDPKPVGGSMVRLNRDTRFSKDKSPYKTNAGAMFTHGACGDLMLGYHLSLAPDEGKAGQVRAYVGLWEPDGRTLEAVRRQIMARPKEWLAAAGPKALPGHTWDGESLKRPPKVDDVPIPADHPLVDDLKRKSFAAVTTFAEKDACAADFLDCYVNAAKAGVPLMRFLCGAVEVPF
jgi:uncharacterized protein (TIGR02453 family)